MIVPVGNRHEILVDDLLGRFSTHDPREIPFVVEALKSIIDTTGIHQVSPSLRSRVKAIQSILKKPPAEIKRENVRAFKSLICKKIDFKIEQLSQIALISQEKATENTVKAVVPSFTDDLEVNKLMHEVLMMLREHELEQLAQEKGALQLYTPLEGRSDFDSTERFDAFKKVEEFLNSESRCLLLLGDAGAGKTTFTYYLAEWLWRMHEKGIVKGKPIPVLIPLITIRDVEKDLLAEHLINRGLYPEEIALLKKHLSFVFILEGYDERNVFKNLYDSNGFDEWNCKVITSCRSQALLSRQGNYRSYFSPARGSLNEIILCPFTEKEIKKFLQEFVKQHKQEIDWESDVYWKILSQLPSVLALVSNPFVLSMTILALPDLVKKYGWVDSSEQKATYDQMSLTQAELYDAFIDAWFERQLKKLKDQGKFESKLLTKEDLLKFNQEIAREMLQHKTKYLEETEVKQKKESTSLFSSRSVDSTEQDWQEKFFNSENESTSLLRSGWLLKKVGERTYTFLHDSLRAHFSAKHLFHGVLSRSTFAFGHPLNDQLIVDQPDLISSFVDRVCKDPSLPKLLFELLESSKYEPFVSIGAANAITVLNRSKISFSGRDLSRVRIKGADLSGALLEGVNFSEADLRDVKFIESSLSHVNFSGACMDEVGFGQFPELRIPCKRTGLLRLKIAPLGSCTYSPDGKWLAVGEGSGYIHLYDAVKGLLVTTLKLDSLGETHIIGSMCFSPDSQFLAVTTRVGNLGHAMNAVFFGIRTGDNSFIRIWDVAAAKLVCALAELTKGKSVLGYSPDGKTLASGSEDSTVRLWDHSSGKLFRVLEGHTDRVRSISISPKGNILASGSNDTTIRLWDPSSGKTLRNLEGHIGNVLTVCFSPDGKILASGSADSTVRLWDVDSGKTLQALVGHTKAVMSVNFNPDGRTLVSGSEDCTVRLWDLSSGKTLRTFEGHTDTVHYVTFSFDTKTLISAGEEGIVRFWDCFAEKTLMTSQENPRHKVSMVVSPDGKKIASGSSLGTVELWDLSSKTVMYLDRHDGPVNSLSFSPDSKTLVSGGNDSQICLWDVSSGKELRVLEGQTQAVGCVASSPDGKVLASYSESHITLWDLASGKGLRTIKCDESADLINLCFSPDGKTLAAGSKDGRHHFWDVASSTETTLLFFNNLMRVLSRASTIICFSPDSKIVASGSGTKMGNHKGYIDLYEIVSKKELRQLNGHDNDVVSLSFNPEGSILASGSKDKTVRLWDIDSGQCLQVLTGFTHSVISLAWDPTEQWLIAGDESGAIRQYQLPKDPKNDPPILYWCSHGTLGLHCERTTITLATGLSSHNLKLLQQYSALGQVSQKSSEDILFERDQAETVGDSCTTVFGRSPTGDLYSLSSTDWVVSLAHKKRNEHAFLILEGIENKKRVIYQAEVFLDTKRKQRMITVPLHGKLGFGYAYVQIKPMNKSNAEELAKQCYYRSEPITKGEADQLQELIRKDAEHELHYNNLGNNKVYAIAFGDKEYGNCLSFAEKWLKEINVTFVHEVSWQQTLIPIDFTSKRVYLKTKDAKVQKKRIAQQEGLVIPDTPFDLNQMENVGNSCQAVFGCLPGGEVMGLTSKIWVVSLAHKKESEHVLLILEGIENKKRVIYRAEAFLDTKRKIDDIHMSVEGTKSGLGHGKAQLLPISMEDAEELAAVCHFRSESITKTQADQLMEIIRKDAARELVYNETGESKMAGLLLGKEYGNSLTFAEKWLKKADVTFVNVTDWKNMLSTPDTVRKRNYMIPDDAKDPTSGNCVMQ